MIVINRDKFIQMLNNPKETILNKESVEYNHINSYIKFKNKNGGNYTIDHLFNFLSHGFSKNKNFIYKINMFY